MHREGYGLELIESAAGFFHGRLMRDDRPAGEIIVVQYDPQSPDRLAFEVRIGSLGDPREEERLARAAAEHFARATEPSARAPEAPMRWTRAPLRGRWIDLEDAVPRAGVTKKSVDLAVVGVDRWRYATLFDLRSLAAEPARLIVIGDRESAGGPQLAYLRIGLFGNPELERRILARLQEQLSERGEIGRRPETR